MTAPPLGVHTDCIMKHGMHGSIIGGNYQNASASAKSGGGGKVVATTLQPPFPKKPTANKSRLTHGD